MLIVEDAATTSDLIRPAMSERGFDVRTVSTPEEAIRACEESHPKIVLVDLELAAGGGLELVKRLRSNPNTRDVLVLGLGSFRSQHDQRQALDAGCRGCISRPVDPGTFPAFVEEHLSPHGEASNATAPPETVDLTPDPELDALREEFVAEAMQQVEQLVNTLDTGLDGKTLRIVAHRWAGSGGSVGYPEVSRMARELEAAVRSEGQESIPRIRELLGMLRQLFSNAQEELSRKQRTVPAPPPDVSFAALAQSLAGKRFALFGFQQDEGACLARVIERYQAFSRTLVSATLPSAEMVRPFDAVILNAAAGSAAVPPWNRPFLLIGKQDALMELQPVRDGAVECMFSPWTEQELVLRLYRLLHPASQMEQQVAATSGAKRRVLVVDDDSTMRELVKTTLQRAGLECRLAADGDKALEIVRSWQPDLALVDIEMPGKNGFEVLASLRGDLTTFDIPVILLTACQQDKEVIRGVQLGANDYVVKPFDPAALLVRIRKLLKDNVRRIWMSTPGSGGVLYT
jgi:DNA-binding response OmpR family regulator